MNKTNLDFSPDLHELKQELSQVEQAAKRMSELRDKSQPKATAPVEPAKSSPVPPEGEQTEPPLLETKDKGDQRHRRTITANRDSRRQTILAANDPWVSASFKVRNSKKLQLHELSLKRQLAGLAPYEKQHLIDEAIDYILSKYRQSDRGTRMPS